MTRRNSKTKVRIKTCAQSNFHCQTSGNLVMKLRAKARPWGKLNLTTIFLIISTTSSQMPGSAISIQGMVIVSSINLGNDYCKEKQNS